MFKNTKHKGSMAVASCIEALYKMGYEVLIPLGDRNSYDLVFDDGHYLNKVQVKFAGFTSKGKCVAGLRITGGNQSYNYAKKYKDNEFDYLFVLTSDSKKYLIKWNDLDIRNEISISADKYQKYLI